VEKKNSFLEAVRNQAFAFKNHKGIGDIRWLRKNSVNTDFSLPSPSRSKAYDQDVFSTAA
jgi:hypothetical protein